MKNLEPTLAQDQETQNLSTFISVAGTILGISYPVLAISSLARSGYQLFLKEGVTNYLGPALTGVAAILYIIAAIGFARRNKRTWQISAGALALETALTLIVGTLSLIIPDVIGGTVWRLYGIDYAFFPLIQPILGLIWLTRPEVMQAFGVHRK